MNINLTGRIVWKSLYYRAHYRKIGFLKVSLMNKFFYHCLLNNNFRCLVCFRKCHNKTRLCVMEHLVVQRNKCTLFDTVLLTHKSFNKTCVKANTLIVYIISVHSAKECNAAVFIDPYLIIGTDIWITINIYRFKIGFSIKLSAAD